MILRGSDLGCESLPGFGRPVEKNVVTALLAEAARQCVVGADDVEVSWITPDAADQSMPLGEAWSVPFESACRSAGSPPARGSGI